MNRSVHKFGGSSLSTAERYRTVSDIISSYCQAGDIIVVSAAGKTTNRLVKLWQYYDQGDSQELINSIKQLKHFQIKLIKELLVGKAKEDEIQSVNNDLSAIFKSTIENRLKEASLLAHGEVWSARLLSKYLNHLAYSAISFDARDFLLMNDGELQHQNNKSSFRKIKDSQLNIITGFIALDTKGHTVTLGRNGSDYSATLMARYCDAKSVTIWKDTKGVYSADPHQVKRAIQYTEVCREQVSLLTKLGNPILHINTLEALKGDNIKLIMRSSFENYDYFTEIVSPESCKQKYLFTALSKQTLIEVVNLSESDIYKLIQLTQHNLHSFKFRHPTNLMFRSYIIVPVAFANSTLHYLSARASLLASNLFGLGIVCPRNKGSKLTTQATLLLKELDINIRFSNFQQHSKYNEYGIILSKEIITPDILSRLHDELLLENKGAVFFKTVVA
jgi:aspartokinase/homoserine dehydrogenase 2